MGIKGGFTYTSKGNFRDPTYTINRGNYMQKGQTQLGKADIAVTKATAERKPYKSTNQLANI